MQDKDSKTEKASPKRIKDARKKGDIAKSSDLTSAISFTVFALMTTSLGWYVFERSFAYLKGFLASGLTMGSQLGTEELRNNLASIGVQSIIMLFTIAAPFLLIAFFVSLLAAGLQTRFLFSKEPIKMSLKKINPVSGFKNMFSKKAAFTLVKTIFKLILVFLVTYNALTDSIDVIVNLGKFGTEKIFSTLLELIKTVGTNLAVLLMVLGIADYVYERYEFSQKMKMTKQEVKDEYKESEGDPQVKSQRKQLHRQMINGNMRDVETAAVVITNPTHLAIAIRYEKGKDEVPIVVVKGADLIAEKIRERAREHDVPIVENKPIARNLYKNIQVGQPIPVDLYQAVAEIMALVYQMEELKKDKI